MIKTTQIQLLLIALLILMPFASFAQKKQEETKHQRIESNSINLELSEIFYERMVDPEIYMADSNAVYFIKNNTKRWIISYDIANKKIGTKFKISNALKEAGTSTRDITTSFILNKNLVFITQDFSKKTNFLTFYYSIISTDGNVISPKKELTKLYCKKESNVSVNLVKNKSDFELRAKVIIENEEEEEVINLTFGYDFQQKYQFKINNKETLQEKNGEFYPPIFNFSDSIYLINIFAEDKKDKNLERIFHASAYSKSGKLLFTQKLNSDNIYLNSFKVIKVGDEDRLVAYYSESNSNNLDGSVSFVYSPSLNKFIVKENNKMPTNIRPSYVRFKSNKKGRAKGIFEFSEAKTTSNGTLYNINEQSYLSYESISTKQGPIPIEVYRTWTNLLLEKIDSTGKLVHTGIINTPDMNSGGVNQTYHLMVQGNKVGVFFICLNGSIPYYYRELITNYEKKKVRSIYLLKLENSTDRWWRQLKIPMEKGYSLDQLYVIPETNKAFVIFTKRRPAFANFWKSLFFVKRKTKVGIANIRFE